MNTRYLKVTRPRSVPILLIQPLFKPNAVPNMAAARESPNSPRSAARESPNSPSATAQDLTTSFASVTAAVDHRRSDVKRSPAYSTPTARFKEFSQARTENSAGNRVATSSRPQTLNRRASSRSRVSRKIAWAAAAASPLATAAKAPRSGSISSSTTRSYKTHGVPEASPSSTAMQWPS